MKIRSLLLWFVFLTASRLFAQSGDLKAINENQAALGSCTADFTWVDSSGYVFFISNATPGNSGMYSWDFGDGNYSNQQYPANNYAINGTYLVCLTVYDSLQNFCDSTCHFVTTASVASIGENATGIKALSLSPNPSDAAATLSFVMPEAGNVVISVHDIYGREVMRPLQQQFSPGKQQAEINTGSFAAGAYLIEITLNGQSVQSRLIVTHQ